MGFFNPKSGPAPETGSGGLKRFSKAWTESKRKKEEMRRKFREMIKEQAEKMFRSAQNKRNQR